MHAPVTFNTLHRIFLPLAKRYFYDDGPGILLSCQHYGDGHEFRGDGVGMGLKLMGMRWGWGNFCGMEWGWG